MWAGRGVSESLRGKDPGNGGGPSCKFSRNQTEYIEKCPLPPWLCTDMALCGQVTQAARCEKEPAAINQKRPLHMDGDPAAAFPSGTVSHIIHREELDD